MITNKQTNKQTNIFIKKLSGSLFGRFIWGPLNNSQQSDYQ